jgi:hypothetical protein
VQAPGGVFALSPWDVPSPDWVWQNPDIAGVFIRFTWSHVHIAPGTDDASFHFDELDGEVQKAVDNGKLYSLVFKAGDDGTPDWIFANGVTPLDFQDGGSHVMGCGFDMTLGDPTNVDGIYRGHYFDLLTKVAERVKTRADWYRALAYIKPSGANLESAENRLPKRCEPTCPVCNSQVWAEAGYRPSLLYDFYDLQFDHLRTHFPGKQMAYALISEGFPLVGESGSWEGEMPAPVDLPGATEQTRTIINAGHAGYDPYFTIQHNSLGIDGTSLNNLVLQDGAGGHLTGLQSENDLADAAEVDSALTNAYDNSAAVFVELYEGQVWFAANDPALPSGNTLGDWNRLFQERRQVDHTSPADPFPFHGHTFSGTVPGEEHYYIHGSKCGDYGAGYGVIVVDP